MKPFLSALELAINTYLNLDPESTHRLHRLANKSASIELLPMQWCFHLLFTKAGVHLHSGKKENADVTLTGTPLRLCGVMLNQNQRQTFFADDVRMEGSAEVGQQIINLFDHLDIDVEEYLSRMVGDVAAHHLHRTAQQIKRWLSSTVSHFSEDIDDYLHEERPFFPPREALTDFYNDIDSLRMATDRIEARIQRLQNTLVNHPDSEINT